MGAIDNFLKRWGFAKLDRYGLVLTPEDRVLSTRPAVLDDGLGGKIVGWLEGDLAAMELEHWKAPRKPKRVNAPASLHNLPPAPPLAARTIAPAAPAPAPAAPAPVISPIAAAPAPAPRAPRSLPGMAPVASVVAVPTPIRAPAPAPAPVVAASEEPGEDEWEWEIAMARARAAAEEAETARADLLGASADDVMPLTKRKSRPVPEKTSPGIKVVAATPPQRMRPEPEPLPPWPGTEPYNETWADRSEVAPQVMSVLQKKLAVERRTPARATPTVAAPPTAARTPAPRSTVAAPPTAAQAPAPRSTVIPVPQLPPAADPRLVRPAAYTPSTAKGRMAKGTGSPARLEETVRTLAAPANDDHTSPYVELPTEVKTSGFAHTKRVAAKER